MSKRREMKTLTTVLADIGDRRSPVHRITTGVALAAMLFGSIRTGWAAPAPRRELSSPPPAGVSRRVRPVAVEDANGKIAADALWKLFDGDASTGLTGATPARVRMTFAQPIAVTMVGGFAPKGGQLSLRGPAGGEGGETIDAGAGGGTGWLRKQAKQPGEARTFVVDWAPGGEGASLSELEVWGRLGGAAASPAGGALADAIYEALPEGAEAFAASSETRAISVATVPEQRKFSVVLPYDSRAIERAFLTYELDLLPHFSAAMRKINGGPVVGGFAVSKGAKGGLQVEEISPAGLRKGQNTVEFVPIGDNDPVGYRVGRVKLVVVHTADAEAIDSGAGPAVADETRGWSEENGSIRSLRFLTTSQPRELRVRVPGRQPAKLVVAAGTASSRRTTTVDLDKLEAGTHTIALDAFPPTDEVTLGFEARAGRKVQLGALAVNGSPMPVPGGAALRITYPLHGECVNHQVHVRGLAAAPPGDLRAGRGGVARPTLEPGGFSFTASEKELGGGGGEPFAFRVAATVAGRQVETTVPIAGCVDRPAAIAGANGSSVQPRDDVGAPYGVIVKARRAAKLSFGGLELEVPAGAVDKDVRITVRPLSPDQVPVLDATMDNVTAGGRAFRLGPRGMVFKKPVALSIPVDDAKLEPGETPHAFYFDETDKQWHEIQVTAPGRTRIVAASTHFTDFIASTLKLPEHPGVQSLDPTSLKNIKVADPAAGVQMIAPPEVNSQGTANLDYPIDVPPGRLGMQPHLAITYDSDRANGWLGVGWDLATSSIEIDTRFGVPRYDGTEKYMLDGEALVPMSQPPSGAPAGTYYARRREGRFDWIQRVDSPGGGYHWVVTDKAGVKYTYGSAAPGRVAPVIPGTIGADFIRTFKWFLETAEDIHGNQVRYSYSVQRGNNGDDWTQVYPLKITYTAHSSGSPAAPYTVNFNLRAAARGDSFSTGRPGFQVLTQSLLDTVDVKNGTTIVRRYRLTYTTGDFGKTLLQKIEVFGKGSTPSTVSTNPIAVHTLDYWLTPRDANNVPNVLGSPTPFGPDNPYATVWDQNFNPVTGESIRHLVGEQSSDQLSLLIAGGSSSSSTNYGTGMFEDMNGDGMPDYLPFFTSSTGLSQYLYAANPLYSGAPYVLQGPLTPVNFPGLDMPHSAEINRVMTSSYNFVVVSETVDHGNLSESSALHIDVNGDGLPDQVTGAGDDALHVKLNLGRMQGFSPEIVIPNYIKTGLGFDCSDVFNNGNLAAAPTQQHRFPSADVITKWVAPYAGQVRITGKITRMEPGGDGMIASLYVGNTLEWTREVPPNDLLPNSTFPNLTSCTPWDVSPGLDGACGADNVGFVRTVAKGDRIYTRVNAINNADHDGLKWDTTVEYLSSPASEATSKEAWGPLRYKWTEANDQRVAGAYYKPFVAPYNGSVHMKITVAKDPTADDVQLLVYKYTPSNNFSQQLGLYPYASGTTVDPNGAAPIEFDVPNTLSGDEIHVALRSDTPIDPKTIRVLSIVTYNSLCRVNAYTGSLHCGTLRCTARAENDGSSCTVENPTTTSGPSNDPMASTPISGSVLNQVVPTYYPLQRWNYQAAAPPNPPTTSLDGRKKIMTNPSGTNPMLCYRNADYDPHQSALFVIQTVGRLQKKLWVTLDKPGDAGWCVPGPSVSSGQQIIFSVYTSAPINPVYFSASMNGAIVPGAVEVYTPDPSLPPLTRFPYFGGIESMASGYHNFYMGLWNGNADFDESYIDGVGNENYQPLIQAPIPKEALAANMLAFSLNPLDWLEDAYNYVAAFGEYIWDKLSGAASYIGSRVWDGIRWIGSTLGKILAYALCEIDGNEYTAQGIQITESHNTQDGIGAIVSVARSHGASYSGLELLDMNGDRYPDQISTKGIRYAYFDPQTNTGRFCPAPQTSATCGTGAPSVTFPDYKLRDIRHAMHTWSAGATVSPDLPLTNAVGRQIGAQMSGAGITTNASQGYSHTQRDLKDINGDGLPDIIDINKGQCSGTGYGLCVKLNYGYGFSPPIAWASPNWSIAQPSVENLQKAAVSDVGQAFVDGLNKVNESILGEDPPTSQTIRLEEQGHKGGQVTIGTYGYGMDDSYTRTLVDLVDINGDGLPDQLMKLPAQDYRVKFNTGSGFGPETTFPAYPWPSAVVIRPLPHYDVTVDRTDTLGVSVADASSNGGNVVVYASSSGPTSRQTIIELMDIDGDGHVDQVFKNSDPRTVDPDPRNGMVWVRLNQTGQSNLLRTVNRPLGGNFQIQYRREATYVGDSQLPWGETIKVDLPEARWTMSSVSITDNRGGTYQDNIDYGTLGYYDRAEREFFGWAKAKVTHTNPVGSTSGPQTLTFYRNQDYYTRGMVYAEYETEDPVNGEVLHGVVTDLSMGGTANAPNSQYVSAQRTLDQMFNGKIRASDISYPLNIYSGPATVVSAAPVAHYTIRTFDGQGNMDTVIDEGDLANTSDNIRHELHYVTFTGQHFTGIDNVTTKLPGPGTVIAQRDATYTLAGTRPLLTQMRDFVYGGNQPVTGTPYTGQTSTYTFTYDPADLGNLKTATDPTGYKLTYSYDTTTKTHVTSASDTFSLTSSATYNLDFGLPLTTTDANGKVVTYNYDAFGRTSKIWGPTDPTTGQATIQMSYSQGGTTAAAVPWALTQHKDFQSTTGDTIDTVTFVDGLGRVIQTKKEGELLQANGTTIRGFDISGLTVFDASGRVMAQSQPFFNSTTAATTIVPAVEKQPTFHTHDAISRVTTTTTSDGFSTSKRYIWSDGTVPDDALPGFTGTLALQVTRDANAHETRVFTNGVGQTVGNKRFVTIASALQPAVTKYTYDLFGNVAKVIDAKNNETRGTYDSLSRLVSLTSPDAGQTEWRYALTGLLAEKQTPNLRSASKLIKYTYETSRLKTIDYPTMADVSYDYGLSGNTTDISRNRLGRIKTVTMEGGSETRSYDAFGNVSETTTTLNHINNTTLTKPVVTMKYSYDWLGRTRTMTFPKVVASDWSIATGDGEVITYTYDKGGMIDKISGKATPTSTAENYLSDVGYDEFGSRANLVSGNGINTKYTYTPQRHFLSTVTASGKMGSATVQFANYTYGYDPVGNILTIANNPPQSALQPLGTMVGVGPISITNTYDEMDRLLTSTGKYRGHTTYGHSYSSTFAYDTIDNITNKSQSDTHLTFNASDQGLNGGTSPTPVVPTTYSLIYNYTSGKPHQPASLSDTNNGQTRTRTEFFDANGNNTGDRLGMAGTLRTLTWDEADRLKSVVEGTLTKGLFLYNIDGERTQKRDTSNTTSFYFNQFLTIDGSKRMTKHLFAGETRIVSKTESASMTTPARSFYHPDYLSSTSYVSDASQNLVQHERYFPFGERWWESGLDEISTANGNIKRDYLYTGKELDRDTGFYYFGARYLDPRRSNWLSPDPILGKYMRGGTSGGVFQPGNLGLYSYGWNNPVRIRDKDGRIIPLIVLGVVAVVGIGIGIYEWYSWAHSGHAATQAAIKGRNTSAELWKHVGEALDGTGDDDAGERAEEQAMKAKREFIEKTKEFAKESLTIPGASLGGPAEVPKVHKLLDPHEWKDLIIEAIPATVKTIFQKMTNPSHETPEPE
jgi:RHS repeat-associated protein